MNTLKLSILFVFFYSLQSYSQEKKIIGVWTLFFADEEVTSVDCKICPTWEFKKDHTSIFTKPNGQQDLATWEIDENNMLSFKTEDEKEKKIEGLKVEMKFTKRKNFTELRFFNPKNQTKKTVVLRKK
jgi:hypothetical protein